MYTFLFLLHYNKLNCVGFTKLNFWKLIDWITDLEILYYGTVLFAENGDQ